MPGKPCTAKYKLICLKETFLLNQVYIEHAAEEADLQLAPADSDLIFNAHILISNM